MASTSTWAANRRCSTIYPSLPVAETASVFAEMLVFDDLLPRMTDPRKRLALICGKLEDSFATVFRQTVLTRFEQLAYAIADQRPVERRPDRQAVAGGECAVLRRRRQP